MRKLQQLGHLNGSATEKSNPSGCNMRFTADETLSVLYVVQIVIVVPSPNPNLVSNELFDMLMTDSWVLFLLVYLLSSHPTSASRSEALGSSRASRLLYTRKPRVIPLARLSHGPASIKS